MELISEELVFMTTIVHLYYTFVQKGIRFRVYKEIYKETLIYNMRFDHETILNSVITIIEAFTEN